MSVEIEASRRPEEVSPEALRYQATVLASNFYPGPSSRRIKEILSELTEDPSNSWLALRKMTDEEFKNKISSNGFVKSISDLYEEFRKYMSEEETWFDKTAILSSREKEYLREHPIVSFSLEIAINNMPQIYSGGLGMLNGDEARQESDMNLPVERFSLLYRGGYFIQKIDGNGCQIEEYCDQNGNHFPMSEAEDINGKQLGFIKVPMGKNHEVFAKVWNVYVGRNSLYLLDTNIPENELEADRWITGHVYGEANKDTRIRQEILLGVGGVRALKEMKKEPSMCLLQEGHAAFAVFAAIAGLVEKGMPLEKAVWMIMDTTAFTNHTTVINDFFSKELINHYLEPLAQCMSTLKHPVTTDELCDLGKDDQGRFSMTMLALKSSEKKNGVSEIHTEVLRDQYPNEKIDSITNGVHIETWLGEPMRDLLDKYLGKTWREDLDNKEIFNMIHNIPDQEVWDAHMEQKRRFINYANNKYRCDFFPSNLTACIARRFTSYKRNALLFYDMSKLSEIVGNDKYPTQIFVGGKAHPSDLENKNVIKSINEKIKDPRLKKRVVFVSEYDMELAKRLVAGVDLWINIPRRKNEASGTSGMKAGVNGVLHLSELDGWWNEAYGPNKGWAVGRLEDDATKMSKSEMEIVDRRDAEEMYQKLKEEIVPMYYEGKEEWIKKMKNTMVEVLTNYSTRRMVKEKIEKVYLPILQKQMAQIASPI